MTADDVIGRVRNKLRELQVEGQFFTTEMLVILNDSIRETIIPNLWVVGASNLLLDIMNTGTMDLTESGLDDDWVEGDLSGISNFKPFYRPSLVGRVVGDNYEIPVDFVEYKAGYRLNYDLGTHKEKVLATLKGDTIIVYSDDYDSMKVEAVDIPAYARYDTVALEDNILTGLLVYDICMRCSQIDKGIYMEHDYERMYAKNLKTISDGMRGKRGMVERVPVNTSRGWYGLPQY